MADFFQNGLVTTLHNLDADRVAWLDEELISLRDRRPVALVLPALYSEFEHPAMGRIVDELSRVHYLKRIVVALGQATDEQYVRARSFFDRCPTPVNVLQVDHPRVQERLDAIRVAGLDPGPPGKGRACWLATGLVLALGDCEVVALHDCDIRSYSKRLVTRLVAPMMLPDLDFEFCKGFYARTSDKLHGRVTRLFLTPMIRALRQVVPKARFPEFVDSFRYALAGEFAMKTSLARRCRVPADWGLEVGVLAEVFRHSRPHRVCQVDISDNYDHKHQDLSPRDSGKGLRRMSCDISTTLLRSVAAEGTVLGQPELGTLGLAYREFARDLVDRYEADAMLNGLRFDRHSEESAVEAFELSLQEASAGFLEEPTGATPIPSWARVESAVPGFLQRLAAIAMDTDTERPRVAAALRLENAPAARPDVRHGLRMAASA